MTELDRNIAETRRQIVFYTNSLDYCGENNLPAAALRYSRAIKSLSNRLDKLLKKGM